MGCLRAVNLQSVGHVVENGFGEGVLGGVEKPCRRGGDEQ